MIADTGPLVAAANSRDPDHRKCRDLITSSPGLVVPSVVIAEAGFLIEKAGGAPSEAAFLRSLSEPKYRIEAPTDGDLLRAADLVERYSDLGLGTTDALVVAAAERLDDVDIATLDHRHFNVVRPRHVSSFTLLP